MKRIISIALFLILSNLVIYGQQIPIENEQTSFSQILPFIYRVFQNPVRAIIFFVACFSFIQFLQNKDKSFLYYSFYLLFLLISFIYIINNDLGNSRELLIPSYEKLKLFISPTVVLFYFLFIQSVLELKTKSKKAYQTIQKITVAISGYYILMLINTFIFEFMDSNTILRMTVVIAIILSFVLISFVPSLWKSKEKITQFILIGSFVILLGLVLTTLSMLDSKMEGEYFFNLLSPYLGSAKENDFFILQISSLFEILMFSSALGAKSKQNELKIKTTQQTLFGTQLAIKDQKVLEQSLEIEQQKRLQLETQFQQKLAEAEVKALKAQMNPHFMFNCLNTFRYLIQINETDKAEAYLIKFSKLIRGIVDYSQDAKILLQKEIEICKLYVDLEKMRFKEPFDFQVNVDESVAIDFVEIPPFVFQPFLENAIWHGLLEKKGLKKLSINIFNEHKNEQEVVKCIIKDNGIGFQKNKKEKTSKSNVIEKKSIGLQNTKDRLLLFGELYDVHISTEIKEIFKANGESDGVEVIIIIPL